MTARLNAPGWPVTLGVIVSAVKFARERGAVSLDGVPLSLLESALAHQGLFDDLRRVAAGSTPHASNGLCPDAASGYETRDPACAACRVLLAADKVSLAQGVPPCSV